MSLFSRFVRFGFVAIFFAPIYASATAFVPIAVGDITIIIPIAPPSIAVQFSDSENAEVSTVESVVVRVTPTDNQIRKVEFNLNGLGWVEATLVNGQYEYDFGQLDLGNYEVEVRINGLHIQSHAFAVVLPPVRDIKNALVEYEYDDYGRLVLVKVNGQIVIDYRLDAADNRTQADYTEVQ